MSADEEKKLIIQKLKHAAGSDDTESAHADADDALCEFLEFLGHADVVEEYRRVSKWYA